METGRIFLVAFFISAGTMLCHGLESNTKRQENEFSGSQPGFGNSAVKAPLQSWRFGQSFSDEPSNLQDWKDWMQKRTFGSSFDNFQSPDLQSWKDWMERNRRFNPEGSFTNIGQIDGSKFQRWRDWMSKRGIGPSNHPFNNSPFDKGSNLQSWYDLAKRSGYFGKNFLDIDSNNQMQTWHDWMKKSFGENKIYNSGPTPYFNGHDHLKFYENNFKRSGDKRQFNGGPSGFGSFHRYFTDGLQDWRSTFKGVKRGKEIEKEEKN